MALLQRRQAVSDVSAGCGWWRFGGGCTGAPQMQLRHWDPRDNLDGNIERGFGGNSVIWPIRLGIRADTTGNDDDDDDDAVAVLATPPACLLPGTQTYNPKNGDSTLCFSSRQHADSERPPTVTPNSILHAVRTCT